MDGVETPVKAVEELHGEVRIRDRIADVGEAIGKSFKAAGVVRDRAVSLLEVVILAREVEVASPLVGEEIVFDMLPGRERIDGSAHDELKKGVHQGEEDPEDEPLVKSKPCGVGIWRRGRSMWSWTRYCMRTQEKKVCHLM